MPDELTRDHVVGTPGLIGRAEYWVPAAIVVALPLCVAGWRERRS